MRWADHHYRSGVPLLVCEEYWPTVVKNLTYFLIGHLVTSHLSLVPIVELKRFEPQRV
ncbi:MAG: hypothetical protein ACR2PL_08255 [Dehalococcoidia bacterium]